MEDSKILDWLAGATFEKLFLQGQATQALSQPNAEAELTRIVALSDIEPKSRVLAHELLIQAGHPVNPELAEVYCQTLPATFSHNWWGMPGNYIERLGQTVISFGKVALPCLSHLLDDKRPLGYFGSEEPTFNQMMQYRVCDLAAYFIAVITNISYQDSDNPRVRDEFVQELRGKLSP
ncbi:MAG: hypothetical protein IGS39_16410 [Calothrix sp. C42_A2020_038]|nr:hypothetical protein [Calothrix sp. C42_A2020_038]